MFKTFRQQETVGCNAQGGVMMKATPAPSLVVAQAEFLFKLTIGFYQIVRIDQMSCSFRQKLFL
jgi:hypothetical protein